MLPTVWFRDVWSWGNGPVRPELRQSAPGAIELTEPYYGKRWMYFAATPQGGPDLLFTENVSNAHRLWTGPNRAPYVKDGIGNCVVGASPSGGAFGTTPSPVRQNET